MVGCNCEDCHPATELGLPLLEGVPAAESVVVEFSREPDMSSVDVACSWSGSGWECFPDQEEFQFEEPQRTWFVHLKGPSGDRVVEREPQSTDPGEGWPTSCPGCYPFIVPLAEVDFEPVL